jgi:5'-deoxynucleotidase YfbR-like HD superfamily hydrolase
MEGDPSVESESVTTVPSNDAEPIGNEAEETAGAEAEGEVVDVEETEDAVVTSHPKNARELLATWRERRANQQPIEPIETEDAVVTTRQKNGRELLALWRERRANQQPIEPIVNEEDDLAVESESVTTVPSNEAEPIDVEVEDAVVTPRPKNGRELLALWRERRANQQPINPIVSVEDDLSVESKSVTTVPSNEARRMSECSRSLNAPLMEFIGTHTAIVSVASPSVSHPPWKLGMCELCSFSNPRLCL